MVNWCEREQWIPSGRKWYAHAAEEVNWLVQWARKEKKYSVGWVERKKNTLCTLHRHGGEVHNGRTSGTYCSVSVVRKGLGKGR